MSLDITRRMKPSESAIFPASMAGTVTAILRKPGFGLLARVMLTFMFWSSGFAKLADLDGGRAEMVHYGLEPAWLIHIATVFVLLAGSLLVIIDRYTWLGAGALAVFTLLTIPIAHDFWAMEEPIRTMKFHLVMEHITVVGGLLVAASTSATRSRQSTLLWI